MHQNVCMSADRSPGLGGAFSDFVDLVDVHPVHPVHSVPYLNTALARSSPRICFHAALSSGNDSRGTLKVWRV